MEELLIDHTRTATFWIVGLYNGKPLYKEAADIVAWAWLALYAAAVKEHSDDTLTYGLHESTVTIPPICLFTRSSVLCQMAEVVQRTGYVDETENHPADTPCEIYDYNGRRREPAQRYAISTQPLVRNMIRT